MKSPFVAIRRLRHDELGAAAPLVVFVILVLLGASSMAIDVGVLFVQRGQLQNAVDAAALAAAQDIGTGNPCAMALQYAHANGLQVPSGCAPGTGNEILVNQAASVYAAGDAWTVTAERHQDPFFARFLGISDQIPVRATATAVKSPVLTAPVLPYGVWGGNPSGVYTVAQLTTAGHTFTFRDNKWLNDIIQDNPAGCVLDVPPGNTWPGTNICHWDVGSNDNRNNFKGFLHAVAPTTMTIGQEFSIDMKGGNANEPDLCALASNPSTTTVLFPVLDWATDQSGTFHARVIDFTAATLNQSSVCGGMGKPFIATTVIYDYPTEAVGGGPGPTNVYVLKLWH